MRPVSDSTRSISVQIFLELFLGISVISRGSFAKTPDAVGDELILSLDAFRNQV